MFNPVKRISLLNLTLLTAAFVAVAPVKARAQTDGGASSPALAPATAIQPIAVKIVEDPMPQPQNRLSAGPLGLLFGIGNFTYERALGSHFSLEASPSFMYWGFSEDKLYGGGLGLGASYYFTGDAPRGMRLNAGVTPGFVTSESDNDSDSALLFSAKATLGYNFIWRNGFSLGLGAGVQYVYVDIDGLDSAFNGVLPALDFNLGFAW